MIKNKQGENAMAKILLVDDEEDIREVVGITIESQGHDVITAADGQEAIKMVKKHEPDLIVLDLMMPKMNGLEVVEILKNTDAYNHIPIVMLTAASQFAKQKDEEYRKKVGVEDYISKPFEPLDLVRRIEKILKENYREKGDDKVRYKL